jgi:hypothetical protein
MKPKKLPRNGARYWARVYPEKVLLMHDCRIFSEVRAQELLQIEKAWKSHYKGQVKICGTCKFHIKDMECKNQKALDARAGGFETAHNYGCRFYEQRKGEAC